MRDFKNIKVAVAGTGYVGLSIATLLAQHHHVTAADVIPEKVEKLNRRVSPIQDDYIEKYLGDRSLLPCVGPDEAEQPGMAHSSPPSTASRPMPTPTSS